MSQINLTGLAHLGIRVHDLNRALVFYELLGFKKTLGPVGPEPVAILRHPVGLEINLVLNSEDPDALNVLMDQPRKEPGYTHMALEVSNLDAAEATLEAAGFPITERLQFPDGTRAIFVRDPDRNVVELDGPKA